MLCMVIENFRDGDAVRHGWAGCVGVRPEGADRGRPDEAGGGLRGGGGAVDPGTAGTVGGHAGCGPERGSESRCLLLLPQQPQQDRQCGPQADIRFLSRAIVSEAP